MSHTFIKKIFDGKKNLSTESLNKMAKAFKLKKDEREYFENLVLMNQAASHEVKDRYYRKMLSSRAYTKVNKIAAAHYNYYSKWYYPVIRGIIASGRGNYSYKKLASLLRPRITPREAEKAVISLIDLGLIKKNKKGVLTQCHQHITTGEQAKSFIIEKYHRAMIRLGALSIERFPSNERDISSMTMSIDNESFEMVKEIISACRKKLRTAITNKGKKGRVIQVNFQMFPLSEEMDKE